MENKSPAIEDKYTMLSEIEHVLMRPGLYLGNIHTELRKYLLFKPSDNKIIYVDNVGYNAGLLKLVDEVISNSVDERVRASRLYDITQIDVEVYRSGKIVVKDTGGIPVVIHKGVGVYLPKMIFGMLKTSSNYNNEDRTGVGLNGLGSKLSNIFAKRFNVITCDGSNMMNIQWSNNMQNIDHEKVTKSKEHFTRTEFEIDLKRFEMEMLDMNAVRVLQKRCIDAAAANPGLIVTFKSDIGEGKLDSTWQFNDFEEFVKLHVNSDAPIHSFRSLNHKDNIVITTNVDYNFGFVNGAVCSEGTHMKKIQTQVVAKILNILKGKDIELITERDILSKITIFASTFINNPDYDSQSKDKLTNKLSPSTLTVTPEFLATFEKSEIVEELVDYYNIKYLAEQKKQLKKINTLLKVTKSKKLHKCNSSNKEVNELWLFEGTSAANGFKAARDVNFQACYLLRGKVKNTLNLTRTDIINNVELREIIATLGLQFGDPKYNLKNCNFGKIIIACDADTDGSHITGLLIVFLAKHFPELFVSKRVHRALSPIIVASKGNEEKFYYTQEAYEADAKNLKGYTIDYKKGLGALEDHHYEELVGNKRLERLMLKEDYMDVIKVWFDKSTEQRKAILGEESNLLTSEDTA